MNTFDIPRPQLVWFIVLFSLGLMMPMGYVPAAWAQSNQFFVANFTGDTVTVYSRKAMGNVAPLYSILTGTGPHQLAINHSASELIVSNNGDDSVSIYDVATGAYKRTIVGASTGLNRPTGVAVDEVKSELYVSNDKGDSITVYDAMTDGDAGPLRTITSSQLSGPVGLALDLKNGEIVVATQGEGLVLTFALEAKGDVSPTHELVRVLRGGVLPQGIALDLTRDEILVANSAFQTPNAGAILVFARTAEGGALPLRRLEGPATQLCNPFSVMVDTAVDEIIVANSNFGSGSCAPSVTTYSRTATGNATPKRMISGELTALSHPTAAAITSASTVTVKSPATKASVTVGSAVQYNISATASGGPVFNAVLIDTLPDGLTWSVSSASACQLSPANQLKCDFGDLPKGATVAVTASAISMSTSCPGITNQAFVSYNDGTADVMAASPPMNITIKCR